MSLDKTLVATTARKSLFCPEAGGIKIILYTDMTPGRKPTVENLIRRFFENAEAGDHYMGRDFIKIMVNILLAEGCDDIFDDHKEINILGRRQAQVVHI